MLPVEITLLCNKQHRISVAVRVKSNERSNGVLGSDLGPRLMDCMGHLLTAKNHLFESQHFHVDQKLRLLMWTLRILWKLALAKLMPHLPNETPYSVSVGKKFRFNNPIVTRKIGVSSSCYQKIFILLNFWPELIGGIINISSRVIHWSLFDRF